MSESTNVTVALIIVLLCSDPMLKFIYEIFDCLTEAADDIYHEYV